MKKSYSRSIIGATLEVIQKKRIEQSKFGMPPEKLLFVIHDSDPFGEIRTGCRRPGPESDSCRCGSGRLMIQRLIYGMICRSVPVRAVKTRRLFGFETTSFHVSVSSSFSLLLCDCNYYCICYVIVE